MTPGARVAAAIEILDTIGAGNAAEPTLTRWARGHRFAGSGDRAAIRDHVFDVLRRKRSCQWLGGGETGRQMMIGWARITNAPMAELFSGIGHAPAPLDEPEQLETDLSVASNAIQLDCPDWLWDVFRTDLSDDAASVLQALQKRAPVFLRVNRGKTTRDQAQSDLAGVGIETRPHELSETALEVITNPRKIRNSSSYLDGIVELQDAGSQAVVEQLPLKATDIVLDYCAGGGGKSLAIAANGVAQLVAHDSDVARMADLPARAERADAKIEILATEDLKDNHFDLVLCDAPCSGSGSWRRSPGAKWDISAERLDEYTDMQMNILTQASKKVRETGILAYVTCSVFGRENQGQVASFLHHNPGYSLETEKQYLPTDGGDGFYVATLRRASTN